MEKSSPRRHAFPSFAQPSPHPSGAKRPIRPYQHLRQVRMQGNATACMHLGDELRRPDCALEHLTIGDADGALHLFECLVFNHSVTSLNLTEATKPGALGHRQPLDRQDLDTLIDYLQARPSALGSLRVAEGALTSAQLQRLAERRVMVLVDPDPDEDLLLIPRDEPLPIGPRAPAPPGLGPGHLQPATLAKELNGNFAESTRLALRRAGQSHVALQGQCLSRCGVEALRCMLERDADGDITTLDLRQCELDSPIGILGTIGHRRQGMRGLWLDARCFGEPAWIALRSMLQCGQPRSLVLTSVVPSGLAYLERLLPELIRLDRRVDIWADGQCLHQTADRPCASADGGLALAPPLAFEPPPPSPRERTTPVRPTARLSPLQLSDALQSPLAQLPALRAHLLASQKVLRYPREHLSKAHAPGLAEALKACEHEIDELDLSGCTFGRVGLLNSGTDALHSVLGALNTLPVLVLRAQHLRAADWDLLAPLVTQGRLGVLRLRGPMGADALKRARRLIEAARTAGSATWIDLPSLGL